MHVAPKRTRSEVPWTPPHRYQCSEGHVIHADRPVDCCPGCTHGHPCPGQLGPQRRVA